jgi:hypothetical protein
MIVPAAGIAGVALVLVVAVVVADAVRRRRD